MSKYWQIQLEKAEFYERLWKQIAERNDPALTPDYCHERAARSAAYAEQLKATHAL